MISNVKQMPLDRIQGPPQRDLDPLAMLLRLEAQFPTRPAGSRQELGAQRFLARQIAPWVDSIDFHSFRFNTNLYLLIGLHFLIGLAGTVVGFWSSALAAAIHFSVALLYTLDSTRLWFVIRRILPHCTSQNMIATQTASSPIRKRLVLVAHVDAAREFSMFHWRIGGWKIPLPSGWVSELLRPFRLAVVALILMAIVEWSRYQSVGLAWDFPIAYFGGNVLIGVIAFSCLRSVHAPVVVGANDNLSGCVGLLAIAKQLDGVIPNDVEVVYVFTGCEESGTGGAYHLAKQFRRTWNPDITSIIVLDGLGGGELTLFLEGEILPVAIDRELVDCVDRIAYETQGQPISRFRMLVGATDLVPFVRFGFKGISMGTIDVNLGMPRHYHLVSDTVRNIDPAELVDSIQFSTELCWRTLNLKATAVHNA